MKRRLGSKTATGVFFMERPFFDVDVELKVGTQPMQACRHVLLLDITLMVFQVSKNLLFIL